MPLAWSSQQKDQIWVLNTHTDMKFRTQQITQEEFYYPSLTSVICPIPVLSLSLLTTTGDWTTDRLDRFLILDMSPGGTSPEENILLRRGGDIDHLLPLPLLGQHLQTLIKESLKDPNNLTRKEEED